MKIEDLKFYFNKNRKIKPGLTANRSICYLIENYPEKIQKFAMSFLLNEFAKEEESIALDYTPKCTKCGKQISRQLKKSSGMCKNCFPVIYPGLCSKVPPPKKELEELAKKMLIKDIAKEYNVSATIVVNWLNKYNITERKFRIERRNKVPSKKELGQIFGKVTTKDLAKKYNVAPSTIRKWAKKYQLI